jgi:hypothetical protein
MAKLKIGFSGLTVPEQIERARLIVTRMTGNAAYPTPSPTLADVSDAANALETAYNDSRNRDKNKVAIMKLRRKEMLFLIGQLAAYVQQASGADEEKILSSGFDVRSSNHSHPVVAGEVHNVRVTDGSNSGKIKVSWDKAANAVVYIVLVSTNPDGFNLESAKGYTTRTSKEIGDLDTGVKYWIRVVALGREEIGPLSEPADIIVR